MNEIKEGFDLGTKDDFIVCYRMPLTYPKYYALGWNRFSFGHSYADMDCIDPSKPEGKSVTSIIDELKLSQEKTFAGLKSETPSSIGKMNRDERVKDLYSQNAEDDSIHYFPSWEELIQHFLNNPNVPEDLKTCLRN